MQEIEQLQSIIDDSRKIVLFSGAGVSTESGIPDFRSDTGLYKKEEKMFSDPPETILSHTYFYAHTDVFFDYYRSKMVYPGAKPNASHFAAAKLEEAGKLSAVITQNIDGLYQMAGCKNVLELHGTVHKNTCTRCGKRYALSAVLEAEGVPHCDCGGIIKPDVVLYEEPLDEDVINGAVRAIREADCLIVAGTSLTVYPAAGFVRYFRGEHFVLINRDETAMDGAAELVLRQNVGEIFKNIRIQP